MMSLGPRNISSGCAEKGKYPLRDGNGTICSPTRFDQNWPGPSHLSNFSRNRQFPFLLPGRAWEPGLEYTML